MASGKHAPATAATAPSCEDCGQPLRYEQARFSCANAQCAAIGIDKPVWRVLRDAGLAAPTRPGLPRPVHAGLPVPWVTASTDTQVWWRAMNGERLARAQAEWLCQVCGDALPDEAWVLATPEGLVLQAALHEECMRLALRCCPHLSSGVTRSAPCQVSRQDLVADGRPLLQAPAADLDFLQQWELAPAGDEGKPGPAAVSLRVTVGE